MGKARAKFDPADRSKSIGFVPRKKLFQLYIPYFKSLIEGEKWIRNWYEWWAENEKLFETVLTRSEYLRWKHFPIQEIEKFLKESSVFFRRSYQYVWLDGNCMEFYLNM